MIIYFPVSALVTIFANVLQNPQDTRARSDLKLMNLVVNFLSMLCQDGENGSVMKMLSVCTEFERVAKLVLDKSEKDSSNRRKRKPYEEKSRHQSLSATNTTSLLSPEQQAARRLSAGQLAAATTAANGISSQNAVQTPQQSELSSMVSSNSSYFLDSLGSTLLLKSFMIRRHQIQTPPILLRQAMLLVSIAGLTPCSAPGYPITHLRSTLLPLMLTQIPFIALSPQQTLLILSYQTLQKPTRLYQKILFLPIRSIQTARFNSPLYHKTCGRCQ